MTHKIVDNEYERTAEGPLDALLILGNAMVHASIYEELYYPSDINERVQVRTGYASPVSVMNLAIKSIIDELNFVNVKGERE